MKKIEIVKPDDWHIHFRDNEIMRQVVPESTRHFGRGIIMPNLVPPILSGSQAIEYKKRIIKSIPKNNNFKPFMTVYLTEKTKKNELKEAHDNGSVFAAKLYPAGATTNSESGVKDISRIIPVLEKMSEIGMPLLIHGEVTDKNIDIFDRERVFIEKYLEFIIKELPDLKITLEHITTKEAVEYVNGSKKNLAASITPHHLALNRNAIFSNGINPHNYCLPILKREKHKEALVKAAVSGNSKFFLGTDTAPHLVKDKENSCGCAGIFNATYCMQILAQIFENENSLSNLEKFTSKNGSKHYNLNINEEKITLVRLKEGQKLKKFLKVQNEKIRIFDPNFTIFWKVKV